MNSLRHYLLLLAAGLLVACTQPDEQARLEEALNNLVGAVEQRSVRKVNQHLTTGFKTTRNTRVENIQSFMQLHFRSNAVIHIFTSDRQLLIENGQGQISFNALVTGSSHWLPERGRRFYVKTGWLNKTGDWKLDKLDWEALD